MHGVGDVLLGEAQSASLARTASPRWMRTGVSTIWPLMASTSKYSGESMVAVMLLGSVNWFFEVILASMFTTSARK
ncbi:hypothetical protein [Propionivibrio sp.]|uniref:hypothetical protein n=1 Tax=Propionivibrio sp. TaxID=2212460 RepID=UPI0025EF77F0|nr:hypothetical protein [Propionivibrio sp.]MBK8745200.1 hypothetical protein [Propionivibrio sp.]